MTPKNELNSFWPYKYGSPSPENRSWTPCKNFDFWLYLMLLSILIDLDIGEDGGLFPFSSRLLFWKEAFKVFFLKLGEWVLEFLPLDLPIDPWDMVRLRTEGWSLPLGSSKIISTRSRFIPSMETIEEALDRVLGVLPSNFLSKYLRRLKTPSVPINRKLC